MMKEYFVLEFSIYWDCELKMWEKIGKYICYGSNLKIKVGSGRHNTKRAVIKPTIPNGGILIEVGKLEAITTGILLQATDEGEDFLKSPVATLSQGNSLSGLWHLQCMFLI